MALWRFFRAEVVEATRKEAREIPPYATRRAKPVRKKKPGRSARNDGREVSRPGLPV
jgi:hypothetical protein